MLPSPAKLAACPDVEGLVVTHILPRQGVGYHMKKQLSLKDELSDRVFGSMAWSRRTLW